MKSLLSLYLVLWSALIAFAAANSINLQTQSKGIAVEIDGKAVANASTLNLSSGSGIVWACTPGPAVTCTANLGITVLTKPQFQSGACDFLNSTNGTTAYKADLGPACQVITALTAGMHFLLAVDTANTGSASLDVGPGPKNIKDPNGNDPPAGTFQPGIGHARWVVYDGQVWRYL